MPTVAIEGVGTVAFPDSMSEADIAKEAGKLARQSQPNPVMETLKKGVKYLPDAGGLVGGLVGGIGGTVGGMGVGGVPGALGGAALGGAGGEAAKQLLSPLLGLDSPETSGAAAGQIAQQGGLQGAYEAGGGLLGKGAGMVARGIMGRVLPRAGKEVVEAALKEGVRIGKPSVIEKVVSYGAGSERVKMLRQAAAGETKQLLQAGNRAGIKIAIDEIALPAIRMEEQALERQLSALERTAVIEAVRKRAATMLGSNRIATTATVGARMTPTQTKLLKRVAQQMAEGARKAGAIGLQVTGNPKLDHAVALGTREALENRLNEKVAQKLTGQAVGMAGREARTGGLIGLERAVAKREASNAAVTLPITGPFRLGAATPGLALPPEMASSLALLLNGPLASILRQAPRAVGAVADNTRQ